jgi:hypothetical protein
MYSFTTITYMTYISCGKPGVGEMFFLTSSQGHMIAPCWLASQFSVCPTVAKSDTLPKARDK